MGLEWLETAKQALETAGFRVETGYPGGGWPVLTETVAGVNVTGCNSADGSVTVTAAVLTPRTLGLGECQEKALLAAQALAAQGTVSFDRWQYDETLDCYCIELAAQIQEAQAVQSAQITVSVGGVEQEYVTRFYARQASDRRLIGAMGEAGPVGITPRSGGWSLELVQVLPETAAEPSETAEPFVVTVRRGSYSQMFTGCCWSDYSIESTDDGLRVTRKGFALGREES